MDEKGDILVELEEWRIGYGEKAKMGVSIRRCTFFSVSKQFISTLGSYCCKLSTLLSTLSAADLGTHNFNVKNVLKISDEQRICTIFERNS